MKTSWLFGYAFWMRSFFARGQEILESILVWLARRLGPWVVMTIVLAVGVAVLAVLAKLTGEVYEEVAYENGTAHIDQPVLNFMLSIRAPWLNSVVNAYTHIGGKVGGVVVCLVLIVVLSSLMRSVRPIVLLAASALGSVCISIAGKEVVGRERPPRVDAIPPYEVSPSFPSGHTLSATAIMIVTAYLLVLWMSRTCARVLAVLLCGTYALTMGLSRVYLGHHWLTDVIAGFGVGAAWGVVVILAHQVFHTVRRVRATRGLDSQL